METADAPVSSLAPSGTPLPAPALSLSFDALGLHEGLVRALREVGYETPTPIQEATIPVLLRGSDLLGQAQTGTGKTAAFALPLLSRLDLAQREPQALVLVPTRELAIQVAEAFQKYAAHCRVSTCCRSMVARAISPSSRHCAAAPM